MTETTEELWGRHLKAGMDQDIDSVMENFAEDAVVIGKDGVYRGKEEIRDLYKGVLAAMTPEAAQSVQIVKATYTDDLVYFHFTVGAWNRGVLDFAVVKDGKIATVATTNFPAE